MKRRKIFGKSIGLPEYVFCFAILAVILSLLAFYTIDLRNIFGARDGLFESSGAYFFFTYQPFFFHHWGRNSGLAEIIQWSMLGFSSILASFAAAKIHLKNNNLFKFWAIMSVAFLLMMLEDAGNIRHTMMGYIQWIFNEPDQGVAGTLAEFLYFAVLGGLPLYALIRYWKDVKVFARTKIYLLIGFVFYASAASLSFIGTAFEGILHKNIYTILGEKFYQFSINLGDPQLIHLWESWNHGRFSIGFFLMDSLIEENLEIIGAGALLAATISFLIYINWRKKE
jgi:hypothetical protein